ncbi:MAG TPA: ATP-grasp domain-containing protein [Longimicrobium sp.]|jgi:predicted ATP-grasp superfamily ATP-dependent carboligase
MKRRVLVTDGEERAALAVVRSLGCAGHAVRVASPRARPLAGASRWCAGSDVVPDPLREPAAFAAAVRDLCARHDVEALLPVTEASLLALLPESERPPGVVIPFPPLSVFRAVSDKRRVLEAAAGAGIAVPRQHVLARPEDRAALSPGALSFPVVLKPSRSVAEEGTARAKRSVAHAADWLQLHARLASLPASAYPVLLQERIVGPGVGIFLLLWDGRVRAAFAHRRLREKPPAGGVSVLRESVAPDPALVRRSADLLARFGWQGVAMVELKVERRTGTPYLMEVNGRFWGSLQLAVDAGVDFPALLLDAAFGAPAAPPPAWTPGVRSRWEWGEVDHLLARLRRSKAALDLPPDAPGRGRAVLDFVFPGRGARGEVFRWGDPAPALRETLDWVRRR